MRDQDVWWSLQPFLQDEDSNAYPDAGGRPAKQVAEGTVQAYALAQKHGVKDGLGHGYPVQSRNTATQAGSWPS